MRSCLRHPSDCHNSRLRMGERTADAADRRMAAKELKERKKGTGTPGGSRSRLPKPRLSPCHPLPPPRSHNPASIPMCAPPLSLFISHFSFLIRPSPKIICAHPCHPRSLPFPFSIFHRLPSAYSAPTTASPISRVPTRRVPSLQISPVRSPSSMTLRTAVSIASAAACSLKE